MYINEIYDFVILDLNIQRKTLRHTFYYQDDTHFSLKEKECMYTSVIHSWSQLSKVCGSVSQCLGGNGNFSYATTRQERIGFFALRLLWCSPLL
jgi:hypothetical protein